MSERPQNKHLKPAQPGEVRNPHGRPKGSRNKLGEQFVTDMLADWEEHGPAAIKEVRQTKPDAYLKVIAMILPRDLNVNINSMDSLSDEQLIERVRSLDAAIRPFLALEGAGGIVGRDGSKATH